MFIKSSYVYSEPLKPSVFHRFSAPARARHRDGEPWVRRRRTGDARAGGDGHGATNTPTAAILGRESKDWCCCGSLASRRAAFSPSQLTEDLYGWIFMVDLYGLLSLAADVRSPQQQEITLRVTPRDSDDNWHPQTSTASPDRCQF